ncbi:MAG TPA: hypothetical protein VN436_02295 [Holophaga sp.]|nr:hypothetical protein [Holophaga sp.]
MARFILHHEGVYNVWTTVADGPCYNGGLTLEQLREVEPVTDERLARAHATGCSSHRDSLDDCISINRAGLHEVRIPRDEFIRRFLTIQP